VTPLHHEIAGPDGAPTVLLGGSLGTTLEMWDPQVRTLEHALRVVRFDHRGHGRSPVPPGPYEIGDLGRDVVALLDRLEIQRTAYCGISLGGMVGMWLAVNAPERIDKLILICTSAHLEPESAWTQRAAAVRAAQSTLAIADGVLKNWLTPQFAAANPDVRAWLRAMFLSAPATGYAACCEAIAQLDLRPSLGAIATSTLVVAAEQDHAIPPEHGGAIARAIAGARFQLLSGAAHLASVERAATISSLIIDHLDLPEVT
jgi:3-oxoadipate enol-lactonase